MSGSLAIIAVVAVGAFYTYRQHETTEDHNRVVERSNAEAAEQAMAHEQELVDDDALNPDTRPDPVAPGFTENQARWDTEMKFWAFYDQKFQAFVDKLPESDLRHLNSAELAQMRAIAFDYYDEKGWDFQDFDNWSGTPQGYQQILQGIQNEKLKTCRQTAGYNGYAMCQSEFPLGDTTVTPTDYTDSTAPHSNAAGSYAMGYKRTTRRNVHANDAWHN